MTEAARHHDAELDERTAAVLAADGLQVRRVDDADRAQTDRWLDAVARGFLDGEPQDARRATFAELGAYRRKLGVYDDAAPEPAVPVATFASWETVLSTSGGMLPVCAISAVTVAPTHRRRGLLRALMVGELRTAASAGIPAAALTVSESTIYGRFGFGAAVVATTWEIDVRRARWIGPEPSGRIDFVGREAGEGIARALHERIQPASPGEVPMPGGHWERFFGTRPDAEKPGELRVLQYRGRGEDGAVGEVDGVALYRVIENHDDFTKSTIEVQLLLAATDEAYAGLWRFLLSMDLIGTLRASELAVDEPLWWMIADQRAARITLRDHEYLRILDVPAALAARAYDTDDTIALEVDDPLEIAGGTFVLTTDAASGTDVAVVDDPPVGIPLVRLGVAELGTLLLGGASATTLARAGRIETSEPERIARVFQTVRAPRLSFWY